MRASVPAPLILLLLLCWGMGSAHGHARALGPAAKAPVRVHGRGAAPPLENEAIDEFRRSFGKLQNRASRIEAVLTLEGVESARVVDTLVDVLEDEDPDVVQAAVRVLSSFETRPPVERMLLLVSKGSVEERVGLLTALAQGRYAGTRPFLSKSLEHARWQVRRAATQALAAGGDREVVPLLEDKSSDREAAVRCAALEGLVSLAPEVFLARAAAALQDPSWQVRACVVAGLAEVRERASVELLLPRLRLEEGRLVQDVENALARLTGRDFGLDPEPWERFWSTFGDTFEPPSEEELQRLAEQRAKTRERYEEETLVRYHGVATPSRSILFLIDVSASMEQLVKQLERHGLEQPTARIELVKRELIRTIDGLEPYVEFNVVAFSTEVREWKRSPVKASRFHKQAARQWVERLEALGGASKQQTIHVPENVPPSVVTGLLDLESGRTNTYGALKRALAIGGRGVFDRHYEVAVDTVFLLSDGDPSAGELVGTDDIRREIQRANKLRRVVIHTIAIGEFYKRFMQGLAEDSGGVFVDLGF